MTDITISQKSRSAALQAEGLWDRFKRNVSARLGMNGTAIIQPFRGFGDADRLWVRGRVIEDPGIATAIHSPSLWSNIRHTYRRYETDEIPGARVAWTFGKKSGEVETDEEGFFDFHIEPGDDFDSGADWQDVHLSLTEAPDHDLHPLLGATVSCRTPSRKARFGVISDIDDTIVYTGATNFLKHWRTVVANSAESRQAYDHVAEFYDALAQGSAGPATNPFFYVSSSPWNLFDLFERFMILNGIPLGPMLLKDFGLDDTKWLTGGHDGHKTKMIRRVLETYPHLQFVLIGDSGQRDLDIYTSIAEREPHRVKAVVIHDVTPQDRDDAAQDQLARLEKLVIPAIYTSSYRDAHQFCERLGLAAEPPSN